MITTFTPLFSAGFGELVGLIFVMVSVIGYIIKNVQGNNQQLPPPVQRPGRRREERAADELDSFLQQVNRQPQADQPRQNQGNRNGNNRQRSQGNGGQSAANQRQAAKPAQRQQNQPRRLVDDNAARREAVGLGTSGGGESVSQHVRERMGERIAQEAQRDVGQDIKDRVLQHMGASLLAPTASSPGTNAPQAGAPVFAKTNASRAECCTANRTDALRKMLSNPESIRQAIIIQEILNRPKCLRQE